jgi:hypothetical protein
MTKYVFSLVFAAASLAGCGSFGPVEAQKEDIIASISVGGTGILYADARGGEALPWGPPGIFTAGHGLVMPDNVAKRLVLLDADGKARGSISTEGSAVGIVAVADDGDAIVALDKGTTEPRLVWYGHDGRAFRTEQLSIDWSGVSGIARDDRGLIVEVRGGEQLLRVSHEGGALALTPTNGWVLGGQTLVVEPPAEIDARVRVVKLGDHRVEVATAHRIGRLEPVGSAPDGTVTLLVEDVVTTPVVMVEQSLWRIGVDGTVVGTATLPSDHAVAPPRHIAAVAPDGRPVAMSLGASEVELRAPAFRVGAPVVDRSAVPAVPASEAIGANEAPLVTAGSGCLYPWTMIANATEYTSNATSISAKSISNDLTCTGRWIPEYLSGSACYVSVPYDWGGFDKPTDFNSAMAAGKKAGNWNNVTSLSCSYGVDCSGFVSRVWGLSSKQSTSTLPSYALAKCPKLTAGDALNKAGEHVVLFDSNTTNGVNVYESTHYQNYDRVVYDYRPWSTLSGYVGLRAKSNCIP